MKARVGKGFYIGAILLLIFPFSISLFFLHKLVYGVPPNSIVSQFSICIASFVLLFGIYCEIKQPFSVKYKKQKKEGRIERIIIFGYLVSIIVGILLLLWTLHYDQSTTKEFLEYY